MSISKFLIVHRLSSSEDALLGKRKRCDELETQVITNEGVLSKVTWMEQQKKEQDSRISALTEENDTLRKDLQRTKDQGTHALTQLSIDLKTKDSLCNSLQSRCDSLMLQLQEIQNRTA